MTKFIVLILLFVNQTILFGQNRNVMLDRFTLQGRSFSMAQDDIIKAFGQPKIVYPQYDCGFFSNESTGRFYYQLTYSNFIYIGSEKENFVLEKVEFDLEGQVILKYGDKTLSGQTTKTEWANIFGQKAEELLEKYQDKDGIILFTSDDDGVRFTFRDGRLKKFEYWTPC